MTYLDSTSLPPHVKAKVREVVDSAPPPSEALIARLRVLFAPAVEEYWRRVDSQTKHRGEAA